MAATYDRCWFPWELKDETVAALYEISPHASTAGEVADLLRKQTGPLRGFTFGSSLASAWSCLALGDVGEDEDGRWHHHIRFGKNEHACRNRGCKVVDIDNAAEIVAPRI